MQIFTSIHLITVARFHSIKIVRKYTKSYTHNTVPRAVPAVMIDNMLIFVTGLFGQIGPPKVRLG